MTDQRKLMGTAPEKKVPVDARVWNGTKLALWRSKVGWDIAARQAAEILSHCRHAEGCPGATDDSAPCMGAMHKDGSPAEEAPCPDREIRMSALVVLSAAQQFAPVSASKLADQPYMPPSREVYSEVVAELSACQAELEVLRGTVVTVPPPNEPNGALSAPGKGRP